MSIPKPTIYRKRLEPSTKMVKTAMPAAERFVRRQAMMGRSEAVTRQYLDDVEDFFREWLGELRWFNIAAQALKLAIRGIGILRRAL